jgi:hypothetical protein
MGLDIRHSHARIIIEFGEMNFRLSMETEFGVGVP